MPQRLTAAAELAEDWSALERTLEGRLVETERGLRWHQPVDQGDGDFETAGHAAAVLGGRAQGIEEVAREQVAALEAEHDCGCEVCAAYRAEDRHQVLVNWLLASDAEQAQWLDGAEGELADALQRVLELESEHRDVAALHAELEERWPRPPQ